MVNRWNTRSRMGRETNIWKNKIYELWGLWICTCLYLQLIFYNWTQQWCRLLIMIWIKLIVSFTRYSLLYLIPSISFTFFPPHKHHLFLSTSRDVSVNLMCQHLLLDFLQLPPMLLKPSQSKGSRTFWFLIHWRGSTVVPFISCKESNLELPDSWLLILDLRQHSTSVAPLILQIRYLHCCLFLFFCIIQLLALCAVRTYQCVRSYYRSENL